MLEGQVKAFQGAPVDAVVIAMDPFGHRYDPAGHPGVDLHEETMTQYTWTMDHDHCSKGVTNENVEKLNLYQLTQSFKKECGMELMKTLLRSGQASPEDFMDNGNLSGDDTLPKDINTLNETVGGDAQKMAAVLSGLGGSFADAVRSGNVDEYIKGLVAAKFEEAQKAQENPANE